MYFIFALLAFSVLIIVHELGHFIVAKLNGICVEEFSIGMGPKLIGFKGKETAYNIRVLPFGGFVRMLGENEDVGNKRSFSTKTPLQKILVMIAGAFMNYLLAIVIIASIAMNNGYIENKVKSILPGSPAETVGLQEGDKLIKINGNRIYTADDLLFGIAIAKGNEVTIEGERNGTKFTKIVTPIKRENGSFIIGINQDIESNPTLLQSINYSFKESFTMISQTFQSLRMLITGEANLKTDVGGPITIIKMSSQAAKNGIWNLLKFMAFLSAQLAVFNLLPFPALDGGMILIQLIQLITRREIPEKYIETVNTVGFACLMLLMVVVTLKDIIFPIL